jgi:heat-inducible transcriptional repressor
MSSAGSTTSLSDREAGVLLAVVESYISTAKPAGSRRIASRYELGVSPATVRNTMADLEQKGYLSHPHTSAGRMPTDLAYRYYVDALMTRPRLSARQRSEIRKQLVGGAVSAIEELMQRAAQVLGLITGELGLAVAPALESAVLEKLELVPVSSEKALLVLSLESGVIRTVYVDLPTELPRETLTSVAGALNERLAGCSLQEIKRTLSERLRDLPVAGGDVGQLMNIFVESGPDIFEWALSGEDIHLGSAALLAEQPEFTTSERLRELIELTERREVLAAVLGERDVSEGPQITIGAEHGAPELTGLTIVTGSYAVGNLSGVVGVIGPTRMPYEKVVAVVDCTSSLVSNLARS